ncbi:MBL fold metallo-hydrolase [Haladaptatus sp. DJG-WS-42]|uniref:MBL fold metallo-hydrolase n=1 Tax=Haladaptatus sp. DJG-WS-42 TaxID=3120516 RepID=UPI0030CF02E0
MANNAFPTTAADIAAVRPETLKERIDKGESVFLLDVRATEEFDQWHIDGKCVETENVPYFEFLMDEDDDSLYAALPDDQEIIVLCAKGGSSEYVAALLEDRGFEVSHLQSGMNGWASIYDYTELDTETDATIAQYQRPSSGCLAYLVVSGDEAAVIDPLRAFADEYVADARAMGAELKYALDTHIHADHISGVRTLARETDATAGIPAAAAARGVEYDDTYETVEDGDELTVGDVTITAIHTPGHTSGMTAYAVGDVLFTGDTLFTESVARPDLEDGAEGAVDAAKLLYDSLTERILTRDSDSLVAPAHFSDAATPAGDGTYTARLGDLEASMAALSMDRDEFVEFILSDMPPRPANYEDIIAANLGTADVDDAEAFALELGPNNCAASQDALTSN